MSSISKGVELQTYDLLFKPCVVCTLLNCVVEVIRVTLVLILEFVEKIEEVEREGCRRTKCRGRKPARMNELNPMVHRIGWAMTILDNNAVNSIHVKHHVVNEIGWVWTMVTWTMTKLNNLTEGSESRVLKEQTGPSLKLVVSGRSME